MQAVQNLSFVVSSPKFPSLVSHKRKRSRVRLLPDGREIRRGYQYEKRRREVLKRNGYACVRCGALERLEVHHRCKRSIERDDRMDALETLCFSCHQQEHTPTPAGNRVETALIFYAMKGDLR
jgi:5-methylcytosine-specific restriction endonuclease McrA